VSTPKDLPRDIGVFIRDLRRNARISLRQLADQAGVSNPYLSQIERGLRKPSAEVLQQLASALRVSTPVMYLRAGLLDAKEGQGVLDAIAADPDLTMAQKQSLTQIYETFRRENHRLAEAGSPATPESATPESATGEPATEKSAGEMLSTGEPPAEAVAPERPDATLATPRKPSKSAKASKPAETSEQPIKKVAKKATKKAAAAAEEE
jgi:transcriptional regulator with XRE-family HTH domain